MSDDLINKNALTFEEMSYCKNYDELAEAFASKFNLDLMMVKKIMFQVIAWEKLVK